MDKKILFFDIDGTILSHRTYQVSESTKRSIKQAQANGHVLMINTGRVNSFIDKTVQGLGFDGFICGCGTHIIYKEEDLFHTELSKDLIQALIRDLREYKIEAVLEGSKKVYYDHNSTSPIITGMIDFVNRHQFNTGSWDDSDIIFDKLCIWPEEDDRATIFYEKYKDVLDFIDREGRLYEIVPKGYSKASGIDFMLQKLGIPYENTFAFGDGENDLPMLTYAKHSIAMGNAPESIKNIVTYVTADVDHDGIEQALTHFKLI
ncbi:MAG: ykrA1 [Herbinix sp.]|jgi:Cof subfamily protein (haloacid dehalogenase superfamily)|nr:ykrA1 [Herbinix sp.]